MADIILISSHFQAPIFPENFKKYILKRGNLICKLFKIFGNN